MRQDASDPARASAMPSMYRRILIVGAVFAALAAAAVSAFFMQTTSTIGDMVDGWSRQRGQSLIAVAERMGQNVALTAKDYAVWDETWEYVSSQDAAWAEQNLEWLVTHLEFSGVAVLDLDARAVYTAGVFAGQGEATYGLALSDLSRLLQQQAAAEVMLFEPGTESLYLLAGSRIVPASDEERTGPYNGFLILSRVLDQQDIAYLETVTGVTNVGVIQPSMSPTATPASGKRYAVPLSAYLGPPGLVLGYDAEPPLLGAQLSRWRLGTAISIAGSIAGTLGVLITAYTIGLRPFRRLTSSVSALAQGSPWHAPDTSYREHQTIADAITHAVRRQKAAEQRERQRADELRLLLDNLPAYVVFKGLDGRYITVNRQMADALGRDEADIVGRSDSDLFPPEVAEELQLGDAEVLTSGETYRREVHFELGGREVVHLAVKVPLRDLEGHISGLVGLSFDISEQRQLEEALRRSQALETVGQLAGGVAHDFNNVLTAIIGGADLALSQVPRGSQLALDMTEVIEAATRASQMTRQLLLFSRSQSGERAPIDANEVISSLGRMLRRLLGEDVALDLSLSPRPPIVLADRTRFEQILLNLSLNARDAMPQGGRLSIRTSIVPATEVAAAVADPASTVAPASRAGASPQEYDHYLLLDVTDTVSGISAEARPQVFDPFFTTKQGHGTGLGLTVVQTVVSEYEGRFWFRSEPDEGCTFSVALPITERTAAAEQPATEAPGLPAGSETIMIVEDDDAVRLLTERVLSRQGYSVLAAASASAAMETLDTLDHPPALLLSDVIMPGMSGIELARILRDRYPSMRVLLTSGYPGDSIASRGLESDLEHILPKPYSPSALAQAIREALDSA